MNIDFEISRIECVLAVCVAAKSLNNEIYSLELLNYSLRQRNFLVFVLQDSPIRALHWNYNKRLDRGVSEAYIILLY